MVECMYFSDKKMGSRPSEVNQGISDDPQPKAKDDNYDDMIDERGDYIFFGPTHRVRTNSEPKPGSASVTQCACALSNIMKDNLDKESAESSDKEVDATDKGNTLLHIFYFIFYTCISEEKLIF